MKDKAYAAWKEKRDKARSHLKALGYDPNTEDEDEEDADPGQSELLFGFNNAAASMPPVETSNTLPRLNLSQSELDELEPFGTPPDLADSDTDLEADDREMNPHPTALLNNVAYQIYKEKIAERKKWEKTPKALKQRNTVVIKSVADFDRPGRPTLMALPRDRKALTRLAKLCPERQEALGPYERWVMADSGSSLHAMDVAKELPGFAHLVAPLPEGKKGRGAETASGDHVEIRGTISLAGHVDGHEHVVPFNDMKISMPIASMQQTIKKGNDLSITPDGGTIRNRKTGKTIKLHERGGVYFFKMSFLPPHLQKQPDSGTKKIAESKAVGFARPA